MTMAVAYVRISDDRVGQGLGVARQEKDCRALAKREGWDVAEVIVDNDRPAYSGRRRPGYEQLLDGLKAGTWQAVVAWHPDRLHRSPKELEGFIDLLEATGVKVATVMAGAWDLSTASARMTARVVGAVPRHESEQKSERIRRKHQELAEAGHPVGGGTRPFGYLPDRVTLDPLEAPLVVEAAQSILDGVPLRGVVRSWNLRGVPTVTGVPWHSHTLRQLLTAPRSVGVREHGGNRYPGSWAPLLDEVTWRRLRAILLDPARRVNQSPRTYLLTGGLAVCGLCGAGLVARPRSDRRRSYVCSTGPGFHGCGKIRALADPLEADVVAACLERLDAVPLPPLDRTDTSTILRAIDDAEAAQTELADDYYAHRSISRQQFQSASAALQVRLGALRSEVASVEHRPSGKDSLAILRGDDLLRKRGVIAALAESVTVNPAVRGRNFYDPTRVKIAWRN